MKKSSPVRSKSFSFALNIITTANLLNQNRQYVISNQLLKSGTSIGANIVEAQDAQSKPDFQ